ncbi:transposase [Pararhizobium capsulatum DSM 1112]|uniref:Transposase n=1 Tax=Pararhizobium capsulatum DSM 1112 TaxID=1121113 RepID=A0ABU0BTM6_9HYPH|nr:IS110 family transposase [Pararhizobium capsulatum]MDQ0319798.1 transposase [Pararhizobium capsulatum DSM 1112]MDQ0321603.1 transposase [Pararhizobium capsulatum DSM 1112]
MQYYAGLDVSLEETAICVVDQTGKIVREMVAVSEPEALAAALAGTGLSFERIGMEACGTTAWLHDGMQERGVASICIDARRANAAMKTMPNKTDRNDARSIAQIMRTGWFTQVHVKSRRSRQWRATLTARRTVAQNLRDIQNAIRALLREEGIKLGRPSSASFIARAREAAGGEEALMAAVEPLLAVLTAMEQQLNRLTKIVMNLCRSDDTCRRLMTVPGVGPITAVSYVATIDDPSRFRRSRDVGAHLGLTPRRYQSGETDTQGHISRCGDEAMRALLYEAANALLCVSRKWSSLKVWGMAVAKRRGLNRARVAVARKLATILHHMWSDETDFRYGKEIAA